MATNGLLTKIAPGALSGTLSKMSPMIDAFGADLSQSDPYAMGTQKITPQGFGTGYDPYSAGSPQKIGVDAWKPASFGAPPTTPAGTPGSGTAGTSLGGDWAGVDRWNNEIQAAAAKYGLDPNQIKAVMKLESNGDPNALGSPGVWGPMQVNSNAWGNGPWMSDPAANIMKGAEILKMNMDEHGGSFYEALRAYHGYGDDGNTTDTQYADIVTANYNQLQSYGGGTAHIPGGGQVPATGTSTFTPGASAVINFAQQYVGVPYVWGGIPGKGDNPWDTGWDCSGFTYWLDQTKGTGNLPMGSHYQYQYAQQNGSLFTDMNQLQPGDIVFIDTGWMGGAGSEMNRAGHVGMYIGNGKIINALNPSAGTVISDLYSLGTVMGAMHETWSGGTGGMSGSTGGGGMSAGGESPFERMRRILNGG